MKVIDWLFVAVSVQVALVVAVDMLWRGKRRRRERNRATESRGTVGRRGKMEALRGNRRERAEK